jgi:lipopolysaccharide assembly outer membrane protein LptD (OstA)
LKTLLISGLTLAALAYPLVCQSTSSEPVEMTAEKMTSEGSVLRGVGAVEAKLGPLTLHAEAGVLNRESGEVTLTGHVQVVLPPRSDHYLFLYNSSALVTENAVDIFADEIDVKSGILQGSGHVRILAGRAHLTADRIEMLLTTAEALVTGDVQAVGVRLNPPSYLPQRLVPQRR